jgi:hypothetical protein
MEKECPECQRREHHLAQFEWHGFILGLLIGAIVLGGCCAYRG